MNTTSSIRQLLLALTALAIAPAALAKQCGDVSPLLSQLGEHYYELENIPKSELKKQSIKPNKLLATLQSARFKTGQGKRTLCFGASILREEVKEFALDSIESTRINGFNEIVLNAYEYDNKTTSLHRETVFIPLSRTNISLNGNNGFVVNKRHRQTINSRTSSVSAFGGGSQLREISITATGSHKGVEINQSIYVNGHLAEWFTWYLAS